MTPAQTGELQITNTFQVDTVGATHQVHLISRSQILAHRACPRREFLTYRFKLMEDQETGGLTSPIASPDLAIGSAVHKGVEVLLAKPDTPLFTDNTVDPPVQGVFDIAWAIPDLQKGLAQGFARVDPMNKDRFEEHLRILITGLLWVAKEYLVPSLLESYTLVSVEHEFKPVVQMIQARNGTYVQIALQGRTDGIFTGEFDVPVIFSLKTAATYGEQSAGMQTYDTQGLTESYLFSQEFPDMGWPMVQMATLVKGKKTKKDGMVTYDGVLTRCYRKVYAKGGDTAYSPKYTTGWEAIPVTEYPGGQLAYYKQVLAGSPELEKTWARPMAEMRSAEAALDTVTHIFKEAAEFLSVGSNDPRDYAPHNEDCQSWGAVCSFHPSCQTFVPLESLGFVPRTPHHPVIETGEA